MRVVRRHERCCVGQAHGTARQRDSGAQGDRGTLYIRPSHRDVRLREDRTDNARCTIEFSVVAVWPRKHKKLENYVE